MDASDFVLGGFASVGATFFTNPIEVSMRFDKVITTTLTMLIDSIEMDDCFCFFLFISLKVIKTRIQLQGELAARGTYVEPYKGIFHAFTTVAKNDGMTGLQKGLVPALYFQFIINSFR